MRTRLLQALDLMELGIELMRQNIARQLEGESAEHIQKELNRWLFQQPPHFIARRPSSTMLHE